LKESLAQLLRIGYYTVSQQRLGCRYVASVSVTRKHFRCLCATMETRYKLPYTFLAIWILYLIKDVMQEKSINHHDKLGNHNNPIFQPLLAKQQRRRLKKLWPADLIDG
jgi:hypothetical protein